MLQPHLDVHKFVGELVLLSLYVPAPLEYAFRVALLLLVGLEAVVDIVVNNFGGDGE